MHRFSNLVAAPGGWFAAVKLYSLFFYNFKNAQTGRSVDFLPAITHNALVHVDPNMSPN